MPVAYAIPARRTTPTDYALSGFASSVVVVVGLVTTPELQHWMVMPVGLAGALGMVDGVRWCRRRLVTFDPVGLLGLYMGFGYLVAPLLHVRWGFWLPFVKPPLDWRPWLGWSAVLTSVGLVLFRALKWRLAERDDPVLAVPWVINRGRFWLVFAVMVSVAAILQVWVLVTSGGVSGYLARAPFADGSNTSFQGMGWLLALSESLPILLLLGYVVWRRDRGPSPRAFEAAFVLVAFSVLQLVTAGFRGSRGNTVWAVIAAAGVISLCLRRVPRSAVVAGGVALLAFMYVFGLVKADGLDALGSALNAGERRMIEAESGRTLESVLLGDLARADVQALVLERRETIAGFEQRLGSTYLEGALNLVPSAWLPDRPPGKRLAGTELLYGESDSGFTASNIYGLAGEWMLNFPVATVPIAFVLLGIAVGAGERWYRRLACNDSRVFLVPFVGLLFILGLTSDLDNVLFSALKFCLLPGLLIVMASSWHLPAGSRRRRSVAHAMS